MSNLINRIEGNEFRIDLYVSGTQQQDDFRLLPTPTNDAYVLHIQTNRNGRNIRKENPHKTNHNQIYIKKKLLSLFLHLEEKIVSSNKRVECFICYQSLTNVIRVPIAYCG